MNAISSVYLSETGLPEFTIRVPSSQETATQIEGRESNIDLALDIPPRKIKFMTTKVIRRLFFLRAKDRLSNIKKFAGFANSRFVSIIAPVNVRFLTFSLRYDRLRTWAYGF
jgi:hypothetical protein